MAKKIQIIIGSGRPVRFGETIADWVKLQADTYTNEGLDFEIVDLRSIDLPFSDEMQSANSGVYENEHTKQWASIVGSGDGFIFVSPEYNAGYSAILKNALDTLYAEWDGKPAAIVGYGQGPGLDSAAQLRQVLERLKMKPIDAQVNISSPWSAFNASGELSKEHVTGDIDLLLKNMVASVVG